MSVPLNPIVGNWYKDVEGETFEVVAIDEDENTIEIQYFGGDIAEFDFESWETMCAETVEAPEDWSGPFDEMERDDLGYTDMNLPPDSQGFSLEDLE